MGRGAEPGGGGHGGWPTQQRKGQGRRTKTERNLRPARKSNTRGTKPRKESRGGVEKKEAKKET